MAKVNHDRSLGNGVYFSKEDYVGIARRALIIVVDASILTVTVSILLIIFTAIFDEITEMLGFFIIIYIWAYMTVLKISPIRTPGYAIAGARIVNLQGKRPSIFRMTFRFMMWILGPFNMLIDLLWVGIDDDRQTLRDRFSGTMVVRNHARSIGDGEIHLAKFYALGMTLFYPRVTRIKPMDEKAAKNKIATT